METLKKSEEYARKAVFRLLRARPRILIGELSLEVAYWSLSDAEALLEQMTSEGILRKTTGAENTFFSITVGYVLV